MTFQGQLRAKDDAVTRLEDEERGLLTLSRNLAALLSEPNHPRFHRQIRMVLSQIEHRQQPYRAAVQAVQQMQMNPAGRDRTCMAMTRTALHDGGFRISLWPKVSTLIARQLDPIDTPLVSTSAQQVQGRQDGAINNMMRVLFEMANPLSHDRDRVIEGTHADISMSGEHFLSLCAAAYRLCQAMARPRPRRFLDVGCGGGTKLLAASSYFEQADGLEIDAEYVHHARTWLDMVRADGTAVIAGDALSFDRYGDYDVIYFYRPFSDPALQQALEERIVDHARPGTVVIGCLTQGISRLAAPRCQWVEPEIFITGLPLEEVRDIYTRARSIGPDVGLADAELERRAGFWQPVIAQSRLNGFEIA